MKKLLVVTLFVAQSTFASFTLDDCENKLFDLLKLPKTSLENLYRPVEYPADESKNAKCIYAGKDDVPCIMSISRSEFGLRISFFQMSGVRSSGHMKMPIASNYASLDFFVANPSYERGLLRHHYQCEDVSEGFFKAWNNTFVSNGEFGRGEWVQGHVTMKQYDDSRVLVAVRFGGTRISTFIPVE